MTENFILKSDHFLGQCHQSINIDGLLIDYRTVYCSIYINMIRQHRSISKVSKYRHYGFKIYHKKEFKTDIAEEIRYIIKKKKKHLY